MCQVPGIEGVTLTGGEPFAQAEALIPAVRELRRHGLSIMIFTGYELHELTSPAAKALSKMADILVTGRFRREERTDALVWRGSANQKVVFNTDRYSILDLQESAENRVEVHIEADGNTALTGFPELELMGTPLSIRKVRPRNQKL